MQCLGTRCFVTAFSSSLAAGLGSVEVCMVGGVGTFRGIACLDFESFFSRSFVLEFCECCCGDGLHGPARSDQMNDGWERFENREYNITRN